MTRTVYFRKGSPGANGVERHNRLELIGFPHTDFARPGTYGMNNGLVSFTTEDGTTYLTTRDAEEALKKSSLRHVGANVPFSGDSHFALAELRGENQHLGDDVRIAEFQKAYTPEGETLFYFPE
jgi:hypothetical protein